MRSFVPVSPIKLTLQPKFTQESASERKVPHNGWDEEFGNDLPDPNYPPPSIVDYLLRNDAISSAQNAGMKRVVASFSDRDAWYVF